MSDEMASFEELEAAEGVEYATIKAYGLTFEVGQVSSFDMIEWVESNEDPAKSREAGLRLLVKSLVDKNRQRIPKADHARMVKVFGNKSNLANGKVIAVILRLNGMDKAAQKLVAALKND